VRKVTESQAGARSHQRLYLGGFEIYRQYNGAAVALERETLLIQDGQQTLALIETETRRNQAALANLQPAVRFQAGNHLGSVSLELDEQAAVITYEEYTPFGSTAYCAGRSAAEVSLKRYRYTGKERDDETGFTYHGARYYAAWLGRWSSPDPAGIKSDPNLFAYCANRPVHLLDPNGREPYDPMADRPFARWLLYGKDTPVRDFLTNDKNLKVAQDAAALVAITAAAIATGGLAAEAAAGAGLGVTGAGAVGGMEYSATHMALSSVYSGSQPSNTEVLVNVALGGVMGALPGLAGSLGGALGRRSAAQALEQDAANALSEGKPTPAAKPTPPADPPGTSRDANGRLRDSRGRFAKDPNKPPAQPKPKVQDTILPSEGRGIPAATPSVKTVAPRVDVVEIKPVGAEPAGWSQLGEASRTGYVAIGPAAESQGLMGVATYNRETGVIHLTIKEINGMQNEVFSQDIGQLSKQELAELWNKSGGDTSKFGNLVENRVRGIVSDATGQEMFNPGKNPSANGADWLPKQLPLPGVEHR
jgi:RHS repeat-associated protein